jgi:hypothetical protein
MDEWVDDGTWDPGDLEFLTGMAKAAVDAVEEIQKKHDEQNEVVINDMRKLAASKGFVLFPPGSIKEKDHGQTL